MVNVKYSLIQLIVLIFIPSVIAGVCDYDYSSGSPVPIYTDCDGSCTALSPPTCTGCDGNRAKVSCYDGITRCEENCPPDPCAGVNCGSNAVCDSSDGKCDCTGVCGGDYYSGGCIDECPATKWLWFSKINSMSF